MVKYNYKIPTISICIFTIKLTASPNIQKQKISSYTRACKIIEKLAGLEVEFSKLALTLDHHKEITCIKCAIHSVNPDPKPSKVYFVYILFYVEVAYSHYQHMKDVCVLYVGTL